MLSITEQEINKVRQDHRAATTQSKSQGISRIALPPYLPFVLTSSHVKGLLLLLKLQSSEDINVVHRIVSHRISRHESITYYPNIVQLCFRLDGCLANEPAILDTSYCGNCHVFSLSCIEWLSIRTSTFPKKPSLI